MNVKIYIFSVLLSFFIGGISDAQNPKADGYKGIWFTLGQFSEFGDKYSGGLGTYTANHIPIAIYSPEANKTFFVYGGTTSKEERHLLIMISYFDHHKRVVPRPVIVYDKMGVDDPHDNASISIDDQGFIWVFVSGRAKARPGLIFKSVTPYCIDSFEKIGQKEMTYPQPWWRKGEGFLYLFTKYTNGRELYWSTSPDGKTWSPDNKLAGMGGHYQVTNCNGKKLVAVFNYHPGGDVDKRTNIYLVQTDDSGKTWKTAEGQVVMPPLTSPQNEALVKDYQAEGKLVYLNDLGFDADGNPVILAVISNNFAPGPAGMPREWTIIHHKGGKWNFSKVCESTHNYDMGSLYIGKGVWTIIGPTEAGPQKWGTGGEMALWQSKDQGISWEKIRDITRNSLYNQSYARRPLHAHRDFYAFWADGDATKISPSRLYFTNKKGDKVWMLPDHMKGDTASPDRVQ